jgi:hypothetical protein
MLQVLLERFKAPDEIDGDIAADGIDIVIVDARATIGVEKAIEGRRLALAAIVVMVPGDLAIPWIAIEGEFEIAAPDLVVAEKRPRAFGRDVIVRSRSLQRLSLGCGASKRAADFPTSCATASSARRVRRCGAPRPLLRAG